MFEIGNYVKIVRPGYYDFKSTVKHVVMHDRGEPYTYILDGDPHQREWEDEDLELLYPDEPLMTDQHGSNLVLNTTTWASNQQIALYIENKAGPYMQFTVSENHKDEFIKLLENMIIHLRGLKSRDVDN